MDLYFQKDDDLLNPEDVLSCLQPIIQWNRHIHSEVYGASPGFGMA